MQLLHKEFAQPLNVVIIVKTNLRTQARAHVILFSSDLALAYAPLADYYGLRFQVESDSIGFRGWWKTYVSNRMISPLALYCVWSKERRIGSQRHGTIPRKEYLCAVR
jgi:hypothetical protein